jgi:hypothetical protein
MIILDPSADLVLWPEILWCSSVLERNQLKTTFHKQIFTKTQLDNRLHLTMLFLQCIHYLVLALQPSNFYFRSLVKFMLSVKIIEGIRSLQNIFQRIDRNLA